jgi:hypothetical protein
MRTLLVLCLALVTARANAATQYARLKCGVEAGEREGTPTFDGYLIVNDSGIQQSPGHLLVRGQPVDLQTTAAPLAACQKAYWDSAGSWTCDDGSADCDAPIIRYSRDWNAYNLVARDSTVMLDCASNSVLETYSSKAALFAAVAREYVAAKQWSQNEVNSSQCLLDKLP